MWLSRPDVSLTGVSRDADGNRVIEDFAISVTAPQDQGPEPEPTDVVARYDATGDGKLDHSE